MSTSVHQIKIKKIIKINASSNVCVCLYCRKIAGLSVVKEFGASGGGGSTGSGGAGGRGSWEPGERWGQEKRGRPESPPPAGNEEPAGLVLGPEKVSVKSP